MAHFDKAESIATNTLLIPDIPPTFFGCDDAVLLMHDAFAEFGPIYTFVQMKGFRRIMIIFQETAHAMKAKQTLDKHYLIWRDRKPFPEIITLTKESEGWGEDNVLQVRVYYGQHYTIDVDPNSTSLQVPEFQRNLLISPPGSPCEGWEQIEEDAPNRAILASDLMQAAEVSDYELDEDEYSLERPNLPEKNSSSRFTIKCAQGTEQPDHLPSITVQDWDGHIMVELDGEVEEEKLRKRNKKTVADIVPTSMPPRL